MGLITITPPSGYPVTVAEARAHLNLSGTDDDALLEGFIATAVELGQNITGRQFVEAQLDFTLDAFPRRTRGNPLGGIRLPLAPLLSVDSVSYLDADGGEQQLLSGEYVVDVYSLVPAIVPAAGTDWPATTADLPNAVRVRYACGWQLDDSASPPAWTGPESIKTWIKVRVATLYEQREALVLGQAVSEVPRSHVDGLLDPYVIPTVV